LHDDDASSLRDAVHLKKPPWTAWAHCTAKWCSGNVLFDGRGTDLKSIVEVLASFFLVRLHVNGASSLRKQSIPADEASFPLHIVRTEV